MIAFIALSSQLTCPVKLMCEAVTYNCTKSNSSWDETSVFLEFKPEDKCYIHGDPVIRACHFSVRTSCCQKARYRFTLKQKG